MLREAPSLDTENPDESRDGEGVQLVHPDGSGTCTTQTLVTLRGMVRLPEMSRLAVGRRSVKGTGPDWVVLDLHASYPAYRATSPVQAVLQREEGLESLTARLDKLADARWLTGVLVRVGELTVGLATARAIGRARGRLAQHKRIVG